MLVLFREGHAKQVPHQASLKKKQWASIKWKRQTLRPQPSLSLTRAWHKCNEVHITWETRLATEHEPGPHCTSKSVTVPRNGSVVSSKAYSYPQLRPSCSLSLGKKQDAGNKCSTLLHALRLQGPASTAGVYGVGDMSAWCTIRKSDCLSM
jgi:hypothetical protein